jgi:hypothetical protein
MGFIEIAIGVAIMMLAGGIVKYWIPHAVGQTGGRRRQAGGPAVAQPSSTKQNMLPPQVTAKALETYERLAKEKFEVIKTALTMGYNDADLEKLDARLEKLVGKDAFASILSGSKPEALASADLMDTELDREIDRLRSMRQPQR